MEITPVRVNLILVLAFQILAIDGAKILGIFPIAGKSHFTCNNAVMKSLIDAGHEVTVITSFPQQASAENYSSIIDVSKAYKILVGQSDIDEFRTQNAFKIIKTGIEIEYSYCISVQNLPQIQAMLKSDEKLYDVVFVELMLLYKCFLPVAEKMKVPVVGTVTLRSWLLADFAIHNPNHPAYINFEPVSQKWKLDHIIGRMINVWNRIVMLWYENFTLKKIIKQFHQDHSDQLESLGKYMDMEPDLIFYNNHASVLPRPMNPNAIDIGGIHTKDANPLTKNIQEFIDEAKHGVILFSLGSVVRAATMTLAQKNAFRDAFAEIPQKVIWKFEEKLENLSSNVMILDWLPQRDILEHKNVIAFISHCGLGGTNEAIYTATPVVACPLFADQLDNAEIMEDLGVAVSLNFFEITKQNILSALNEIVNDTRYYDNMQKLSRQFKDRPMTPQQTVVYWTEYVIRHNGASHLRSPASRLSWIQYYLVDVIFIVTLLLVIMIYLINRIRKWFYFQIFKYYSETFNKTTKSKKL